MLGVECYLIYCNGKKIGTLYCCEATEEEVKKTWCEHDKKCRPEDIEVKKRESDPILFKAANQ